jgi:hypothetical protein
LTAHCWALTERTVGDPQWLFWLFIYLFKRVTISGVKTSKCETNWSSQRGFMDYYINDRRHFFIPFGFRLYCLFANVFSFTRILGFLLVVQ